MLLHIIKRDLKRKRTMNLILFLFIVLAATFLAGSVSNLVTVMGAVDHFLDTANTPDIIIIALEERLEKFLDESNFVSEYEVLDMRAVSGDEIEIVRCQKEPGKKKYEKGNTLAIGTVPENFSKVFDGEGNTLDLKRGEVAVAKLQAQSNDLQVGDVIKITLSGRSLELTIKSIAKDAVFGSQMIGFKRLFLNQEDYEYLMGEEPYVHILVYNVNCLREGQEAFLKEYRRSNFKVLSVVEKSTIKMTYIFDMLIAGILIVVSVCLILISFLILRFTIVFTMQEDYREIGVMKAIGIKDVGIRSIYMAKYLLIALAGVAVGLAGSFPFGKILLSYTMTNFVSGDLRNGGVIHFLCAGLIVAVVLLFCFASTGIVKKFTVMEAIRSGKNGERYHAKCLFKLSKRKRMPPAVYLAFNDVLGNVKRYLVLASVFCIGTLLILLPLKAAHTLKDEGVIRTFGMQPSSVFIETGEEEKYLAEKDNKLLLSELDQIKRELGRHGLESDVWIEVDYMVPCYGSSPEESVAYFTMQQTGREKEDYDVLSGRVPELPNEVMVTEKTARELSVGIGDQVFFTYPEGPEAFIVTGIFQSMLNMGNGFRVSAKAKIPWQYVSGSFGIQAEIFDDFNPEEAKKKIQDIFPEVKVISGREYTDRMIGMLDQLDSFSLLVVCTVLFVNMMITVLTMKTLFAGERGEAAMLKSIGFTDRTLRGWQSMRILLVLGVSIILGTVLSHFLAPVTLGPIFALMGAERLPLITEPLETYVIYPLILLTVTGLAAYLCAFGVNKVDLREINTLE